MRKDLPCIIEERLPKQEKARKPKERLSSDGKVSKQGQRKRKEREDVLQSHESPTQEANRKIKKKRDHSVQKIDDVLNVKGLAEESSYKNNTEQVQREGKKREELLRSGHTQEPLAFMDESARDIDKTQRKKKRTRDRWGQKVQDAENRTDIKESTNEFQAASIPPKEGECDMKKLCVSGMPYDTTEEDILDFFAECGSITEISCTRFSDTARFKGLAFITFKTEAAARKALALDGAEMGGRFIKIEQFKDKRVVRDPPKKIEGCLSAYIGNLSWDVQKIDIKMFFRKCNISSVRLAMDQNTGEFQGYGHVDFADEASLERGIKLNQKQLLGRPVKVAYAVSN